MPEKKLASQVIFCPPLHKNQMAALLVLYSLKYYVAMHCLSRMFQQLSGSDVLRTIHLIFCGEGQNDIIFNKYLGERRNLFSIFNRWMLIHGSSDLQRKFLLFLGQRKNFFSECKGKHFSPFSSTLHCKNQMVHHLSCL